MSIYTQGDFISGISSNQYEEYKTSLDITKLSRKLPIIFVDFYKYVLSLNYHDEINFFHWKNVLTKLVCK